MRNTRHADNSHAGRVRRDLESSGVKTPYVRRDRDGTFLVCFEDYSDSAKVRRVLATLNARTISGVLFESHGSLREILEVCGQGEVRVCFLGRGLTPKTPWGAE